jgi:hypothetical protein
MRAMSEAAREILSAPIPDHPDGFTYAEGIALKLAQAALKGSVTAASELTDRAEGKPSMRENAAKDGRRTCR